MEVGISLTVVIVNRPVLLLRIDNEKTCSDSYHRSEMAEVVFLVFTIMESVSTLFTSDRAWTIFSHNFRWIKSNMRRGEVLKYLSSINRYTFFSDCGANLHTTFAETH